MRHVMSGALLLPWHDRNASVTVIATVAAVVVAAVVVILHELGIDVTEPPFSVILLHL